LVRIENRALAIYHRNTVGGLFHDAAEALAALFQSFLSPGPLLDFLAEPFVGELEFSRLLLELSLESFRGLSQAFLVSFNQQELLLFKSQVLDEHNHKAGQPNSDRPKIHPAPQPIRAHFDEPLAHPNFSCRKDFLENSLKPGYIPWSGK